MTIMQAKTDAALKAAGVTDEQAQAAAEESANLNEQFGGIRKTIHEMHADMKSELGGLRSDFRSELSGLRSDFRGEVADVRPEVTYPRGRVDVLIWAVGVNAAATIAIVRVLLRH
jgi:hypothetical protein